jgi:hypothetical protein
VGTGKESVWSQWGQSQWGQGKRWSQLKRWGQRQVGDREREGGSGLHPIWCRSRRDEAFGQIGRQAAEIMKVERVDPVRQGLARTLDQ